jgi:hypothetical protein
MLEVIAEKYNGFGDFIQITIRKDNQDYAGGSMSPKWIGRSRRTSSGRKARDSVNFDLFGESLGGRNLIS